MYPTIEFIGPRRVSKQPLDRCVHFSVCHCWIADLLQPSGEFIRPCCEIFRDVIEDLGATMPTGEAPTFGSMCGFDCIPNILAVAVADFPDYLPHAIFDTQAIARVRPDLLTADEQIGCAIDRG